MKKERNINLKELLEALESHRAYSRILMREVVKCDGSLASFDLVKQAFFAFEIEDDNLAKILNKFINEC